MMRRAGAPRLIEWTGERCVPWAPDVEVVYEHMHRYLWAARVVRGRRVLDLGSGEGFGAAILADVAAGVVGIDVDERTVEHSKLNYAAPGLSFSRGSATDLSRFETGSFGAVVAFEIIEHVADQDQVLDEIVRVLANDGLLVMSTPDRLLYTEGSRNVNPFHARELSLEEFSALISGRFEHHAIWGQRTISGSYITAVQPPAVAPRAPSTDADSDFFIERAGTDWRQASVPAPLYLLAVASRAPLGEITVRSTLGDPGNELVRAAERGWLGAWLLRAQRGCRRRLQNLGVLARR